VGRVKSLSRAAAAAVAGAAILMSYVFVAQKRRCNKTVRGADDRLIGAIGTHQHAAGRLAQEPARDEIVDDRPAFLGGDAKQPYGLRERQAQSWHLSEFNAHTVSDRLWSHSDLRRGGVIPHTTKIRATAREAIGPPDDTRLPARFIVAERGDAAATAR